MYTIEIDICAYESGYTKRHIITWGAFDGVRIAQLISHRPSKTLTACNVLEKT